mgnify:CR=1 FL=1
MNLPQAFIERTRQLLGDEAYTQFEEALQTETPVSIRPNRMKCSQPVEGEPIPWASSGTYLKNRPTFTFDRTVVIVLSRYSLNNCTALLGVIP